MNGEVLLKREGAVATVTLSNPERLNALSRDMWQSLGKIFTSLNGEDDLRCIVIRGAGDKAFAAGADIANFARERANSAQARQYAAGFGGGMKA
ncbi:MAG TPA: enoyl-CoA hydratase/isomerase family protein, partial [Burkholderiales bacterium]|nr:enoyl-CoA hydratase/isomerase family protein [Burkholderiales bacterium]